MVKKPEVLAIVPARGGSKGIPRKNIREFAGYPLIAYSIAAARSAQSVQRVIVSTDDDEIAAVAREFGAETPFLRPAEFASDNAVDLPLFQHALTWLADQENYHPDVVLQLRPTSPLRPRNMVDDAVKLLMDHPEADSVRGVVPSGQNPHKMWKIDPQTGAMRNLLQVEGIPEPYNAPRQVLPQVYWQTGHIDAIHSDAILKKNSMSGDVIFPLMMDPRFTVDIDNLNDWARAEWLVWNTGLDMVDPGKRRHSFPAKTRLVVFDFDGVMTDNCVWVDEEGREQISANRSDSYGIRMLKAVGIEALVLSMETNPVVAARCRKMKIEALQGIHDKGPALVMLMIDRKLDPSEVIYMGNDTNDLDCFAAVGFSAAPADAHPTILRAADLVLKNIGGHGAVRELCDLILQKEIKGD
ncbi:MAG: HAD hydrolase family protein [Anaerolineaceae bacterium]